MELNSKQREAVEYLSGPLLVLAGPGTGKTQLLSEKVAYILSHTDSMFNFYRGWRFEYARAAQKYHWS